MLTVNDWLVIEGGCLRFSAVRSRGPGGQNVNKVSTAVQLDFDLAGCAALGEEVKQRLVRLAGRRATADGRLVLRSDRFRRQNRNRRDCLERLRVLILHALVRPAVRRPTKPTAASQRRRRTEKARRQAIKTLRRSAADEE